MRQPQGKDCQGLSAQLGARGKDQTVPRSYRSKLPANTSSNGGEHASVVLGHPVRGASSRQPWMLTHGVRADAACWPCSRSLGAAGHSDASLRWTGRPGLRGPDHELG